MKTIGNIIWLVFGGFMIAMEYFVASIGLFVTIVGIPFAIQSLKLGVFSLWPFGTKIMKKESFSSGCLNVTMNVIWILIGGFWIALTHLLWGILLCITIIGIPFGKQHFKLIKLAFSPFGKEIVRVF